MTLLARIRSFLRYLVHRFSADRCLGVAAVLSYTTLLSLVPLLAVVFSVVSAFPVFEAAVARIQDYIFLNFVPASGEVVQDYLQRFVSQASKLTGVGIASLVLGALVLMDTIDNTINRIWRVRRPRRLVAKLVVYWSVLTLAPLLIAVSIVLTSYLTSLPLMADMGETVSGVKPRLLSLMPWLSTSLALALLYVLVPNCNVPLRNGLIGAVTAALLFELAKKWFAAYVASIPTYATLYGALAVIPLFLLWIYVSWVLVLLGVELAYCLTMFRIDSARPVASKAGAALIAAFRVVGQLWRAQLRGAAATEEEVLEAEVRLRRTTLNNILARLEERNIVHRTEGGAWTLARDLTDTTLLDLYNAFPAPLGDLEGEWAARDAWNAALYTCLSESRGAIGGALAVPLKQLYQREGAAAAPFEATHAG